MDGGNALSRFCVLRCEFCVFVEVDDEQVFFEVFGLGDDFALGVEDDGVAVEDEFVVSADLVDVDDGEVPALGLEAEEFVAVFVFAEDEGGGGDVEKEFGAGAGECADGIEVVEGAFDEFFVIPEVFADGDADRMVIERGDFGVGDGGFEVTGFVEDVVGGEEGFESLGDYFAIADDGHGIAEWSYEVVRVFLGVADNRRDSDGRLCDFLHRHRAHLDDRRLKKQVLGGITEDGHFGKYH